jgi:hypothetical protein
MKKLLCVTIVFVANLTLAFSLGERGFIRALAPIDFGGKYLESNSFPGSVDTKMGFGIGGEAMLRVADKVNLGIGLQYLLERGFDTNKGSDRKFGFVPIYGLVAFDFSRRVIDPYLIFRIGYNIFKGNDEFTDSGDVELVGGMSFAAGGGASINIPGSALGFFAELDYASNGGEERREISYRRLEACIGLSFNL